MQKLISTGALKNSLMKNIFYNEGCKKLIGLTIEWLSYHRHISREIIWYYSQRKIYTMFLEDEK